MNFRDFSAVLHKTTWNNVMTTWAFNNEPIIFYFYFKTVRTPIQLQDTSPVLYKVSKME